MLRTLLASSSLSILASSRWHQMNGAMSRLRISVRVFAVFMAVGVFVRAGGCRPERVRGSVLVDACDVGCFTAACSIEEEVHSPVAMCHAAELTGMARLGDAHGGGDIGRFDLHFLRA